MMRNRLLILLLLPALLVPCPWLAAEQAPSDPAAATATPTSPEKPWTLPPMKLPEPLKHPVIACTPEELGRLKAALAKGAGDVYWTVMDPIKRAQKAATEPLEFPERGGQHNQWYQCDKCQMALTTVDDTHHKCPKCGTVYTGTPYDDVIFAKKHNENLQNMKQCAWAWAIAGDAACADFATRVLVGYAERYEAYPYHDNARVKAPGKTGGHLMEQTLNEAVMLSQSIAVSYDLLYDRLSAGERKKIETGLIVPLLKNIDKNKAGKNNWQTWHNAAMLAGGAVIGDAAWVEKALTQPDNGFVSQMEISVTGDGMWYENSWGYHFYTLMAMVLITEDARRLNIDLWSHPKLKKMFTLAAQYTMADGMLPRFGDDVTSSAQGNADRLEPAYAVYQDAGLRALLPSKPSWTSTFYGRDMAAPPAADPPPAAAKPVSEVFKEAGHAILRSDGPAGLTGAFTFGPYGGFHGHFDKLSFVFFGFGEELGVDPGRAQSQAYRLPIHTHWYKNTLSHNAVVIDGQPQKGVTGKLDFFQTNAQFTAVRGSCDAAYPGIVQTRLLVLTPEYLLVYDTNTPAQPKEGRRFAWVYHGKGTSVSCDVAQADGKLPDPTDGAEYIQHVKSGFTDQAIQAQIAGAKVTTFLTIEGQAGSTVFSGDGPWTSVDDRVPVVVVERPAGTFFAVLEPVLKDGKPSVKTLATEVTKGIPGQGGLQLIVTREGGSDIIGMSADGVQITRNGKVVLAAP